MNNDGNSHQQCFDVSMLGINGQRRSGLKNTTNTGPLFPGAESTDGFKTPREGDCSWPKRSGACRWCNGIVHFQAMALWKRTMVVCGCDFALNVQLQDQQPRILLASHFSWVLSGEGIGRASEGSAVGEVGRYKPPSQPSSSPPRRLHGTVMRSRVEYPADPTGKRTRWTDEGARTHERGQRQLTARDSIFKHNV